jgi:hypothetical protein
MKKNSLLKININKEDDNLNDYLFCWDIFENRPNKISFFQSFKSTVFQSFLNEYSVTVVTTFKEIYSSVNDNLINRRVLSKITDEIFISYTEFDIETDEGIVSEVHLLFKNEEDPKINDLTNFLLEISDQNEINQVEIQENRKYVLNLSQNGLDIEKHNYIKYDEENVDLYYNDDVLNKIKKIEKSLRKSNKGLTIIYGERGVGKSSLVTYLSDISNKKFIFIPCSLFDNTVTNIDFRNFLISNKETVLILDDSELYFSEIYSKSNIFTNNILQLIDGLDSDLLSLHIVVVLNVKDIFEIDHKLLECNNLLDIIEVGRLDVKKTKELNKYLGKKNKTKVETKLVDILKKRNVLNTDDDIGFK